LHAPQPAGHARLHDLGWSDELEAEFEPHRLAGLAPARVAVEHRGAYDVYTAEEERQAQVAPKLRSAATSRADFPAVGDWVALSDGDPPLVHAVLPRRTAFSRKVAFKETDEQVVAANVDVVFLVSALGRDFNPRRLERYLVTAWESGARPVVVLTKSDLADDVDGPVFEAQAIAFGVPVHAVSGVTGAGLDELRAYVEPGRTIAFLGSSGVGKSTLVNRLAGRELLATAEIRRDGRGRHTTTHRELVLLPGGGLVLDTPGMRELQLWESSDGLGEAFSDVEELARRCRFADCAHRTEPGCAVREAIRTGSLDPERLASYEKLARELHYLEIRLDKRARSEARKRWRAVHRQQRARTKASRKR
jgi:ribosome biogenesis GTPase / thiamine phosphate phosphatase